MRVYLTNSEDPLTPDHLASLLARATSGEARDRAPFRIQRLSARLGPDKCDELCARYAAGETAQTLADEYGASKPAVLTLLRTRNVTVRGRKLSRDQIAQAVREYEAGESIAQIAVLLGFNPAAIWRALKIQGVQMRPKGFQPKGRPARL
jgi:AraC-like DNA-binding protein